MKCMLTLCEGRSSIFFVLFLFWFWEWLLLVDERSQGHLLGVFVVVDGERRRERRTRSERRTSRNGRRHAAVVRQHGSD